HAVEKYGLDITYPEIAEMWKAHINRKIWVANRRARDLMDEGLIPPDTGRKENNEHWFQIDPQLVNEIWSAFYPGMVKKAVERADWSARITNDDWGIHPTLAYAVMYSAAFFVDDVNELVELAYQRIPQEGPFYEGMTDVKKWHRENPDWRVARKLIHEKYYRYEKDGYEAPVSVVSSLVNGLAGVMAILYGEGDFLKTTGIAVSAGYDCDNQAATCAGLIATMKGTASIPEHLTMDLPSRGKWKKPFNDRYINWTRDGLPVDNRISDIAKRIGAIAEKAILENGGRLTEVDGQVAYVVDCDF
ncbi:MAG: ADP-ribosylglycohydrolase family protein, partial [Acidobacteriota bacterium]